VGSVKLGKGTDEGCNRRGRRGVKIGKRGIKEGKVGCKRRDDLYVEGAVSYVEYVEHVEYHQREQ
jgi:hypothetical protein